MLHDILLFMVGFTSCAILLAIREHIINHGRDAWIATDDRQ